MGAVERRRRVNAMNVPGASMDALDCVVGSSASLREAVDLALRVAGSPSTTVLLAGETGTGKELFARGIHSKSDAAREPFVAINCAAIPDNLLESELFGYERGAFTDARERKPGLFESAAGGTIFLDEIGELPLALQPKLLRVLEERRVRRLGGAEEIPVECRVIAGTNVELERAVAGGRFREDLFYRLNVFRIDLPPVRERGSDVVLLAEHFLTEYAARRGMSSKALDPEARALLLRHSWPGNIRELRNVIERACILAPGSVIRAGDLRIQRRELVSAAAVMGTDSGALGGAIAIPPEGKSLEEIEREAIRVTMLLTGGNLSAAARILRISRPTLMRKMRIGGMTRRSLLASS